MYTFGLLVIANMIAWPVAYLASRAYLAVFVHRIPLTPWPFFLSLFLVLLVSLGTVGKVSLGAARVRPAEVLKQE